jgi:hypothetical protein
MKLLTINDSQHFFPNVLNSDLKHLILWLLERQPPPLHLLRTAGVAWWTMLRKHRLFPLLYVRLQRAGLIEAVVPFAAQLLRNDYLAALQLYLRQKVAARRLLHPLRAAGIEVILLKGADLRLRLYEDPASRPMTGTS